MRIGLSVIDKFGRGIAALLLLASAACGPIDARDQARVRKEFPLIRLQGVDRPNSVSTSFRGKVLVVNVWATWCPPCRKEMPGLERLHARLDPARAMVIGVSVENDDHQVREWLKQSSITFPNYLDAGTPSARELLRITSYPQTYIVSPDGRIIAQFEGARNWDDPKWLALVDSSFSMVADAKR